MLAFFDLFGEVEGDHLEFFFEGIEQLLFNGDSGFFFHVDPEVDFGMELFDLIGSDFFTELVS